MNRVMAGIAAGIAVVLMVAGVIFAQAGPGPENQAVMGVGIGQYDAAGGIAYLSGRRLACVNGIQPTASGEIITSDCEVRIAGKTLEIHAVRQDGAILGSCTATYEGREWGCEIHSRHVHVGGFAFINEPLGLRPDQMDGLRQQYFIENQRDEFFLASIVVAAALATLAVILAVWAIVRPATSRLRFAAVAGALSLFAFFGTAISWASVVQGLWD